MTGSPSDRFSPAPAGGSHYFDSVMPTFGDAPSASSRAATVRLAEFQRGARCSSQLMRASARVILFVFQVVEDHLLPQHFGLHDEFT